MAGVQTKIDHIKLWLLYNLSVNGKKKILFPRDFVLKEVFYCSCFISELCFF